MSNPCSPANVVYQGTCTDPGTANSLRHLTGLDSQFCERRLLPGTGGYLVARETGSGGWITEFTTEPVVALSNFTAGQTTVFGNLIVQGADNIMRTLTGPAVAGLYLSTNAVGQLTFGALPDATVPDPLTVGTINVITQANVSDLSITGTVNATGLATGTLTNIVGLDAGNNLIKGTIAATGSQCAMFYESATSPSATFPNSSSNAGANLIIGNLLFDSTWTNGIPGLGGLFNAAPNPQTLTCLLGGVYVVDFGAQIIKGTSTSTVGIATVSLSVNGIIVNTGNQSTQLGQTHNRNIWGQEMRRFNVGDVVRLILSSDFDAANVRCARVNFTRLGA